MKTLKELSRMIAWLVVAGFLFFSGLYFYDAVREYRQEKFSFDRQISELQAQIKAQDIKIISQNNTISEMKKLFLQLNGKENIEIKKEFNSSLILSMISIIGLALLGLIVFGLSSRLQLESDIKNMEDGNN